MNPEFKRRIVMSLVSLALAFGLLATYYIVTVPWNRTAVGQALTAGALLGIAALVMQFIPIRSPVPVAATAQQAEQAQQVAQPQRSWQPEPDFAAEDFQADLAPAPAASAIPSTPGPIPAAAHVAVPVQTVSVDSPPVAAPKPIVAIAPVQPVIVAPAPAVVPMAHGSTLNNVPMTPESIEKVIEAADEEAAAGTLSLDEIKDSGDVLLSRNDHVRVEATIEAPPVPPIVVQPYRAEPAPVAVVPAASKPVAVASKPVSVTPRPSPGARPLPARQSPKTEWREPDPETPKELLRELAEYWHVKYETERKRHGDVLFQYEDLLRRLEVLETRTAPNARESELPLDEMSVADAVVHENKDDLEDRWDRRTAQMERFH